MPSSGSSYSGQERRRHPRFRATENLFALIKNHSEHVGRVIDISIGGLSFRYIEDEPITKKETWLDLFSSRDKFFLHDIPVRTVSDVAVGGDIPFSTIPVRQRSLQFLDTTPHRVRLIDHFLDRHTIPAEP
jgi:hypothetical protein